MILKCKKNTDNEYRNIISSFYFLASLFVPNFFVISVTLANNETKVINPFPYRKHL